MHLLSIIMPVYNVEKYVADTIEAILHQSYSDFELILVVLAHLDCHKSKH